MSISPEPPGLNTRKLISIVIPYYNEAGTVTDNLRIIAKHLESLPYRFEIIAINDGSQDSTLDELLGTQLSIPLIVYDLSRNFGKEAALTAGLSTAEGDAVIPMDADLQDPPQLFAKLLECWEQGYEVVLAKRKDRDNDSCLKKHSASWFYYLINRLSDLKIPENVGDFRLMDRSVIDALNRLPENRRFMKGLFAWAGFRSITIDYSRPERRSGKTKFSGWKLWNLALEGITSFSTLPLRIWTYLGGIVAISSLVYAAIIIVRTLAHGIDAPGYASLITVVLFLGGVQLIGLGIIGEYLGRTYMEAKRRPAFVIRKKYPAASLQSGPRTR